MFAALTDSLSCSLTLSAARVEAFQGVLLILPATDTNHMCDDTRCATTTPPQQLQLPSPQQVATGAPLNTTQYWDIINLTPDAVPIHLHNTDFRVSVETSLKHSTPWCWGHVVRLLV